MLTLLAMSPATKTTIVYAAVWFVVFPAFVTSLVVYAVVQARGERRANEEERQRHLRS
jgi:hypothetical protein